MKLYAVFSRGPEAGAPEAGGRGEIAPLPFNILKTRGHRGQIVPFEICLTKIFLDLLYNLCNLDHHQMQRCF